MQVTWQHVRQHAIRDEGAVLLLRKALDDSHAAVVAAAADALLSLVACSPAAERALFWAHACPCTGLPQYWKLSPSFYAITADCTAHACHLTVIEAVTRAMQLL